MTDKLILDFCEVNIYKSYMIVTMHAGVNITLEHNAVLNSIVDNYYKNKPFVYITHRVNSYSVDPAVYKETSKIANLVGFSVVSKNFMAKKTAEIEKLFLNKPFEIFDSLDEAIAWAQDLTK